MDTIRRVHIVYFSGTGGTARYAGHFADAFAARGRDVTLTALENNAPYAAVPADLLVLLYPVYAANAPAPIDEWIAQAPLGNGMPAAVLSVSGGGEVSPNTACRCATNRALTRKGYRVTYENMLVMPSNFITPCPPALIAQLLAVAPNVANRIAEELLSGANRRTKPLRGDRPLSRLLRVEKIGSRFFGRNLKATDACVGCGWCAENCPRGNITLSAGKPVFGNRCVICLRCVYGCPSKAIRAGLLGSAVLKDGFDLGAAAVNGQSQAMEPPLAELAKSAAWGGVARFLMDADAR